MKKTFLAASAAALLISTASAFAADLPSRKEAPVYVPPPPPALWTGFYAGIDAGGTFGGSNSVNVLNGPIWSNTGLACGIPGQCSSASALGATLPGSTSGFIGGGQIGYNYQFYNNFLVGLEADIQGIAGSSGTTNAGLASGPVSGFPANNYVASLQTTKNIGYLGTVRGRIGYLVTPTLLVFGTGGLAYGGATLTTTLWENIAGPSALLPYGGSSNYSDTLAGWAAGGGVEWMFLPNWSAKLEYLYY
ncbi:MAG: outer membrane beta-barrel protein, partial [Methylocystis sp.]